MNLLRRTLTRVSIGAGRAAVGLAANQFSPPSVTIALNDVVMFTWAAGTMVQHNVTFAGAAQPTITDRSSGSDTRTFTNAGTFNYQCTNHIGMNGSVTVSP